MAPTTLAVAYSIATMPACFVVSPTMPVRMRDENVNTRLPIPEIQRTRHRMYTCRGRPRNWLK